MKRWLQRLHRWIGLALALPIALQGLTGTILTVSGGLSGTPAATAGAPRPIAEIVAAAAAGRPELRPARYAAPEPGAAARVYFGARSGPQRRPILAVDVDPVTLQVLAATDPGGGAISFIRRFHTNFLIEAGGRQINGWIGVGLLVLSVIGVPIWWPSGRFRSGFVFDRKARGWRFQRGLHGAVGGWTALILIVSAGTGAALAFPQTVRGALGLPAGGGPGRAPTVERIAGATPADADASVALAGAAAPGVALRGVMFPTRDNEAVRVTFGPEGSDGIASMTTVVVDQWARRVASVQSPASQWGGERVIRTVRDLHEAAGFGPVWRWLTIAGGISLVVFSVTGWWMWLLRRRNRRRVARARQAARAAT